MGRKILVIDDDALFRTVASDALAARGYSVAMAQTGAQADKELAQSPRPDLLIVDGLLPDTSGLDWLQRHGSELSQTPVLFVSAFWKDAATRLRLNAMLSSAELWPKPLDPNALADRVDERLRALGGGDGFDAVEIVEEVAPPTQDPAELLHIRSDAARFIAAKVRELTDALALAESKPLGAAIVEVRVRCQKLSALAYSCGFDEIGEHALVLEQWVKQWRPGGAPPADRASARQRPAAMLAIVRDLTTSRSESTDRARVLLVLSDDDSVVKQLKAMLPRSLCGVLSFSSAEDAILFSRSGAVDAVLIDGGTSDAIGPGDAVELFRAVPGYERLPVGFIAGGDTRALLEVAKQKNVRSWIARPIARDTLLERVCSLWGVPLPTPPTVLCHATTEGAREELRFWAARCGVNASFVDANANIAVQLRARQARALLIESMAPHDSAAMLIKTVRAHREWEGLPIVTVAKADAAARAALREAGSDDVLAADTDFGERMALVLSRIERHTRTQARFANDAVTGLPSRRAFLEAFGRRMADARRRNQTLTLVLLKVEELEALRQSHSVGAEAVLGALAQRVENGVRTEDLRGVWDRDTLVLVLLGAGAKDVGRVLTRVRSGGDIRQSLPDGSSISFKPRLRESVSSFPVDGRTMLELLQLALKRQAG